MLLLLYYHQHLNTFGPPAQTLNLCLDNGLESLWATMIYQAEESCNWSLILGDVPMSSLWFGVFEVKLPPNSILRSLSGIPAWILRRASASRSKRCSISMRRSVRCCTYRGKAREDGWGWWKRNGRLQIDENRKNEEAESQCWHLTLSIYLKNDYK